jgi:cation:H+ antiporter
VAVGLLLLASAAVALLAGAELFADNAAAAGQRLGVTALAVGVLLAGAEPEELITAVIAATRDRPGIAVGDAIGANITMLTLALGLAAVVGPLPLRGRVRGYAIGASAAGAAAAVALADGRLSRLEGGLLIVIYVWLVVTVWRREQQPPVIGEFAEVLEDDDADAGSARPVIGLALAVAGVGVMALGGTVAVAGAERVVDALSVTDTAVGLTLVALATTAELLAIVWAAARRNVSELAVAAVIGSTAYNATATLGAAALVKPAADVDVRTAAVAAALLPLLVVALGGRARILPRPAGVALVAGYAIFVVATLA